MRYFVTGDKHQAYGGLLAFIDKMKLGQNDVIIILGDMGLFWRKDKSDSTHIINVYEENYQCNLWFIDGNHENFDQLEELNRLDERGLYIVSPHIRYIPRGKVLDLNGKKALCIGGADSVDKHLRTKHLSWWPQEQITQANIDTIAADYYDYVFSHTCPYDIFTENEVFLCNLDIDQDTIDHTSEYKLQELADKISFKHWYFAHFHQDLALDDKFKVFYNSYEEII